ncbi:MAG: glycoside hydrolase family 125 protein [Gemmatimonas sp.]
MKTSQIPALPWQLTGNHWVTLPCIHPADGSIHGIGVLHRGARAAIEIAGAPDFTSGQGAPLFRPVLRVDGQVRALADEGIAWERALQWLPTFTCTVGALLVRGTVFAPYGRDADMAGAVYVLTLENRSAADVSIELALEGQLGHRQQRVRTPRPFDDDHLVSVSDDMLLLEGSAIPGLAAIAVSSDGPARLEATGVPSRGAQPFAIRRDLTVSANGSTQCAFYIAVGPERDGAQATVAVLQRRGWRALLTATREALNALEQTTGSDALDSLVNRNLLFAYFYGVGRALDDAHYYLVRSRAPWHAAGCTVRDWEALMWTLPAVQLADTGLARELLVRACELHGYAPGQGVHYIDGTLFQPGFTLEGPAAYAIATDRYIRDSGDDHIVEEPVVAETLYLSNDDIAARRDERIPLYSTEVTPSGEPAPYPFTLHGNAVVALALDVLKRTLDEEAAKGVQDPAAVRAALRRHFAVDRGGKARLASAIDLTGEASMDDAPVGSLLWLPLYEALDREDSLYRRSVRAIANDSGALLPQLARLLGPDASEVLAWLRRASLHNGVAAEFVAADGAAVGNGGDAALAGLLAHTVWYSAHALGLRG